MDQMSSGDRDFIDDDEGEDEDDEDSENDRCVGCDGYGRLLLCDVCDGGYHLQCVGLQAVPHGRWLCPGCCR